MQAGAGVYFYGHTMRPITCEDRLGSYYVKEGRGDRRSSQCSGTGQVNSATETDLNASAVHLNDIGDCKAECRICKMKISVRAG